MKFLKKAIVLSSLLFSATTFAAGWGTGQQGGVNVINGSSKGGFILSAQCNTNIQWPSWDLYIYLPNGSILDLQDLNNPPIVTAYIEGEKISLYDPSTNVGMDAWNYFWKTLHQAKDKDVTIVLGTGDMFKIPGTDLADIYSPNVLRCSGK